MRKIRLLSVLLFLLLSVGFVYGQQAVQIGKHRFVPEQNLLVRGKDSKALRLQEYVNGQARALVQFVELPTQDQRKALAKEGVCLQDYLGGNAYYASLEYGRGVATALRRAGGVSLMAVRPEWKLDARLVEGQVPDYAQVGTGRVKVLVYYQFLSQAAVENALQGIGATIEESNETLAAVRVQLPLAQLSALATEPWVLQVSPIAPPRVLHNSISRTLAQANAVTRPTDLGGRALQGEGVRVAVFDGDVEPHVDFGSRLHMQEFELSVSATDGHGMHVAGTVGGAGLLDPTARGFAPKASLYTYNFIKGTSGLSPEFKMVKAKQAFDVQLTQNSYGFDLRELCPVYENLSYNSLGSDYNLDLLVNLFPTLTHVFAAGNEAGACGFQYGSSTNRAKNVIHVGAVSGTGAITSFSSRGPMDDGRLLPTVSAMGQGVHSVLPGNSYGPQTGTSMACPAVTGVLALLTERYMQLHQGQTPHSALLRGLVANTAEDRGRPGPDYEYGYGVVNAERAIIAMENGWYAKGSVTHGGEPMKHTIALPEGIDPSALRVMLVWNDTVTLKEYAYRESALINDLDLRVVAAGQELLPWVLDAANPDVDAKPGRDSLNNLEQVILQSPQGGVEVVVKPVRVASTVQDYFVVWYFDEPNLRITYPNGGEQFEPGDLFTLRLQHVGKPVDVEISYDEGKSYQILLKGVVASTKNLKIPTDAPATAGAQIRITDGSSFDLCDAPFTIMGVPQNLRIAQNECAPTAWKLTWDAVATAKEYAVLKAHVDQGSFVEIARVATPEYSLKEADFTPTARNVYSVEAVSESGAISRRAVGVLASGGSPVVVSQNVGLFSERFDEYPSRYLRIELGENMQANYRANPVASFVRPGTHFLTLRPIKETPEDQWFDGDVFKTTVSRATARFCQIDLSKVEPSKKPILVYEFLLGYHDDVNCSQLRFTINGKVVADMTGESVHKAVTADDALRFAGFDLTPYVGEVITVGMEFVGKRFNDFVVLESVELYEASDRVNVRLHDIATQLAPANDGSASKVTVLVENLSAVSLAELPMILRVDGKEVAVEVMENLKPFEQRYYTFRHKTDLSARTPFGAAYDVEVESRASKDINPHDNLLAQRVVNNGNATLYPYPNYIGGLGDFTPVDPYLIRYIQDSIYLTDARGAFENYPVDHDVTVKYKPKTPNRVLVATFLEFETEENDSLSVYTVDLPEEIDHYGAVPNYVFKGKVADCPTIISNAEDGGITFYFHSNRRGTASGWRAVLREVERENSLKISMEPFEAYYPTGKTEIKVTVENLLPLSVENLVLGYRLNGGEWIKESVANLGPVGSGKEKIEHTFQTPLEWSAGRSKPDQFECLLFSQDLDVSDNIVRRTFRNDPYCNSTTFKERRKRTFYRFVPPSGGSFYCASATGGVVYDLGSPLKLYGDFAKQLVVELNSKAEEGESIGVWVDWNRDGQFGNAASGEFYSIDLAAGEKKFAFPIGIPTTTETGIYRMRWMVAQKEKLQPCIAEESDYGEILDCKLNYQGALSPLQNDLSISKLKLPKNGILTANEKITVTLKNLGIQEAKNISVAYSINDGPQVQADIESVLPFKETTHTFENVDLSAPVLHKVKVWIVTPSDDDESNNTQEGEVLCVQPEAEGAYYLTIGEETGSVSLGTLEGTSLTGEMTYEAWVKMNPNMLNNIFVGKGLIVTAMNQPNTMFPENSLAVIIENGEQVAFTAANVVTPGRWQHVAVAIKNGSGLYNATEIEVYVNGEFVPLTNLGASQIKSNGSRDLSVAPMMDGSIDEVRIWKKRLGSAEIVQGMYSHVRDAEGKLPSGCVAEFTFDEGPDNLASISGTLLAKLPEGKHQAGPECVWRKEHVFLADAAFVGQAEPLEQRDPAKPHEYVVAFEPDRSLEKVKGTLSPVWPKGTFSYKGIPVTENTEFDFSEGSIELLAEVKGIFGKDYSTTLTIKSETGKGKGCALESMELTQSLNSGLPEDIRIAPVTQNMSLVLPAEASLAEAIFTFTLSPGAKAYVGSEEFKSGITRVNLSQPLRIDVISENGKNTSRYLLTAVREQRVNWTLETTTFTYGDAPIQLEGTSTAGLPITYLSSNPNVVTVADGMLHISGVGEATVSAIQPGTTHILPAWGADHKISVVRRKVTLMPNVVVINAGDPLPAFAFRYDGLVQPEHQNRMGIPPYGITLSNGTEWNPSLGAIPVGEHRLVPESPKTFSSGNYEVELLEGQLVVLKGASQNVTFTVTDGAAPLANALLSINGVQQRTNGKGLTAILLPMGNYPYSLSLEGHRTIEGVLEVKASDIELTLELPKLAITLTYSAGEGGFLAGESSQRVAVGDAGTPIQAIPKEGYIFAKWSDGVTANPRTDEQPEMDLKVTAMFDLMSLPVHYLAGPGGRITGNATQMVTWGADGEEVTAEGDANHFFYSWDDGNRNATRREVKVLEEQVNTALFASKLFTLPYSQNFNASTNLPDGWMNVDRMRHNVQWLIGNKEINPLAMSFSNADGYYAFINSDALKRNNTQDAELITPFFNLDGVTGDVTVSFKLWFTVNSNKPVESGFYYTLDEGKTWTRLLDINQHSIEWEKNGGRALSADVQQFTIDEATRGSAKTIAFKWDYKATWSYYIAIDDVQVEATVSQYTVAYEAGKGGKVNGVARIAEIRKLSDPAFKVTAQPDGDYQFAHWSDNGSTNPERQDSKATFARAIFTPIAKYFTVHYKAAEHGQLEGITYRTKVLKGSNGTPVYAKADDGYLFDAWSDGVKDNPRIDYCIQDKIEVTAHFVPKPSYTLIYAASEGGEIDGIAQQAVKHGEGGTLVTAVASPGYRFVGWDDGVQEPERQDRGIVANSSYRANFAPIRYSIAFDGNGATEGYMAVQQMLYNLKYPLAGCSYTQEGKNFVGWAVARDGAMRYSDGEEVEKLTTAEQDTVTLYALWANYAAVVFYVSKEDGSAVERAKISINGVLKGETNAAGQFTMPLANGDYTYSVAADGFAEKTGDFTMQGDNVEVRVTFALPSSVEAALLSTVHPNPATSVLMVQNAEAVAQLSVYSTLGQLVLRTEGTGQPTIALSVETLQPGNYLLILESHDGSQAVHRFVKQ